MIFDLEGFSRFFNQPDVSDYLPSFLNHIFNAVEMCIRGGAAFWAEEHDLDPLALKISQRKFMGDGALYVLCPDNKDGMFHPSDVGLLCNRLWNLKTNFKAVLASCADDVPVFDLPSKIRFGLARGSVIELSVTADSSREYVGFCINLASRLQKYCTELGFIGSARVGLKQADLEAHGYRRIVATAIKGFPKEIVIVDKNEINSLKKRNKLEFDRLFQELPDQPTEDRT